MGYFGILGGMGVFDREVDGIFWDIGMLRNISQPLSDLHSDDQNE